MKTLKIFLVALVFLTGCKREEEALIDLDEMVVTEEELAEELLAGEPLESTQELPLEDSESF